MNRKFRFIAGLLLAGTLVFCIVFTLCPGLFGMGPVLAQEPGEAAWQDGDGN